MTFHTVLINKVSLLWIETKRLQTTLISPLENWENELQRENSYNKQIPLSSECYLFIIGFLSEIVCGGVSFDFEFSLSTNN